MVDAVHHIVQRAVSCRLGNSCLQTRTQEKEGEVKEEEMKDAEEEKPTKVCACVI